MPAVRQKLHLSPRSDFRDQLFQHPQFICSQHLSSTGERGAVALANELTGHASAFIDVGARLGYFTFAVAARQGARQPIHYLEPNMTLFAIIDSNVKENGLVWVTGPQVAMGERNGITKFFTDIEDSSFSSLEQATGRCQHRVEVEIIRFDSFTERYGIRDVVVKVDVENAEFRFLDAGDRITHLIIEVLKPAIEADFIIKAARRLGMEPYYISDYRLEYAPNEKFRYVAPGCNWLFTRCRPEHLSVLLQGTRFTVVDVDKAVAHI